MVPEVWFRRVGSGGVLFKRVIMQARCARQCVCVTHGVDKQHALHDVPEAGAAGIRQGVIHPLHYCLEEPTLVLCLERQLPLYTSNIHQGMLIINKQ